MQTQVLLEEEEEHCRQGIIIILPLVFTSILNLFFKKKNHMREKELLV